MDSSSQGASAGAFQPAVAEGFSKLTWAPYGGLRSSVSLTACAATAASVVGARRSEVGLVGEERALARVGKRRVGRAENSCGSRYFILERVG